MRAGGFPNRANYRRPIEMEKEFGKASSENCRSNMSYYSNVNLRNLVSILKHTFLKAKLNKLNELWHTEVKPFNSFYLTSAMIAKLFTLNINTFF